jgi:hypothetical protein
MGSYVPLRFEQTYRQGYHAYRCATPVPSARRDMGAMLLVFTPSQVLVRCEDSIDW